MKAQATDSTLYYPPAESQGGWRAAKEPAQARDLAGLDLDRLAAARVWNIDKGFPSALAIVRHGYLVAEWYEQGASAETAFCVYSCTKAFTATAYGLIFEDLRCGRFSGLQPAELSSPAYSFIPEGQPLTDPRKERITLRHLLTMTSGIPGESKGIWGTPTEPGINPFAAALGFAPFKRRGSEDLISAAQLYAEPGAAWDYSDPAYVHLALAFRHITGEEVGDFMQRRVFDPIGLENVHWNLLGLEGDRFGCHTSVHGGLHASARDMARLGYLMLRGGLWKGSAIVAPWWLEMSTRTAQPHNPQYGLAWWVNTEGTWPGVPRDTFAALGANWSACFVIPSLDLVVVRIGTGPTGGFDHDPSLIQAVVQGVLSE